jgi:putative ABC transport system ATP-binding protein
MTASIYIDNLSHWFIQAKQSQQILHQISIEVSAGEVAILSGPSGCGKTTLLTILAGLRPVQQGRVCIMGQELNHQSMKVINRVRSTIGLIFQSHQLMTFLNARENVQLAMDVPSRRIQPNAKSQIALALLERVGLKDYSEMMPSQLSGGQRQRISIARALACDPKVILADEPTASLDALNGRLIMELLHQIARERQTAILMTSHDQRLYHYADRIIKIEDGHIMAD